MIVGRLPLLAALVLLLGGAACRDRSRTESATAPAGSAVPSVAVSGVDSVRCAALRPTDSLGTTPAGFLDEVFEARETARTPRFHAYQRDSYSVHKVDLATALVDRAQACGVGLHGALIVGPVGPLWAYHVVGFFADSGGVRVHTVVMPHARITAKSAGVVPSAVAESVLVAWYGSPLLEVGGRPPRVPGDSTALGREFAYDALVLRMVRGQPELRSGSLLMAADTAAVNRLLDSLNSLLERLPPTYTHPGTR
jgi:hypothetical protein